MFASSSFITGRLLCQPPSCVVSFGNHRSFPLSFVLIRLSVYARLSFCIHLRPPASSSIICRWPLHLSKSASLFIYHRPLRLQSSAVVPSAITNHCSFHLPPSVCPYINLRSLASSIISSLSQPPSAVVPSTITNQCSFHLPPSVCPYINLRSLASSIISSLSQPPSAVVPSIITNHCSFHLPLSVCPYIHLRSLASSIISSLSQPPSAVVPSNITNHCSFHLPPSVCPYINLLSLASSIISSLSATFSRRPLRSLLSIDLSICLHPSACPLTRYYPSAPTSICVRLPIHVFTPHLQPPSVVVQSVITVHHPPLTFLRPPTPLGSFVLWLLHSLPSVCRFILCYPPSSA